MAQLSYFRFDTDFFDKPKVKGLTHRFGQTAIGYFIRLLCAMGRATDGRIDRDAWEYIAHEAALPEEQAAAIVEYCLTQGILGGELNAITNSRILEDQEALEKRRRNTLNRVQGLRGRQRDDTATAPSPIKQPEQPMPPITVYGYTDPAPNESFDTSDPNVEIALEKLETPAGQKWTLDARFMNAGRRPMKDYPLVWLTPGELADIIKRLEGSDIPVQSYKDLFLKADARLKTYQAQGKPTQSVSVYNWLTGFLFDELLERTIKETRLAKTMEGPQRYDQRR